MVKRLEKSPDSGFDMPGEMLWVIPSSRPKRTHISGL
jgi:hypothetical protein